LKVDAHQIHDASLIYRLMDCDLDGKISLNEFCIGLSKLVGFNEDKNCPQTLEAWE
jgi:hypothetical protein